MPRTKKRLVDDSLIVSGRDKAISNVFVYLLRSTIRAQDTDTSNKTLITSPVVLMLRDGRFEPHAVWLQDSQPLVVANQDSETCYLKFDDQEIAPELASTSGRLSIEPAGQKVVSVKRFNNRPGQIVGLHPGWLRCPILVSDHPYAAITDKDGNFAIKHVPIGEWKFGVYHERARSIEKVFIDGKAVEWKHGRFAYSIHPDNNSLGTIEVPADAFAK